jgi:hypothetical protein
MAVLLVASCSKLVDGRAVIGAPRPGTPVQWTDCQPADEGRMPACAECGLLSVPVDYAKPDGDVAQIAMIRFQATGAKIGSLVINPGGHGESVLSAGGRGAVMGFIQPAEELVCLVDLLSGRMCWSVGGLARCGFSA